MAFDIVAGGGSAVELSALPIEATNPPFTLDFSFRLDSNAGTSFTVLQFDTAGAKQNGATLDVPNYPTACTLSSSFTPNKWYQVSISVTGGGDYKYALDLATVCTGSTGLPGSSLDPLKLFVREAGNVSPSKVTVTNFRLIRLSIDDLLTSNELQFSRAVLKQATHINTLFEIPFISEFTPPLSRHD